MVDDKELPEWYQMAKGFFREIEVFSMSMYSEMNGSGILAQIRYAAIREAAQQSVQADGALCPDCQEYTVYGGVCHSATCPSCQPRR